MNISIFSFSGKRVDIRLFTFSQCGDSLAYLIIDPLIPKNPTSKPVHVSYPRHIQRIIPQLSYRITNGYFKGIRFLTQISPLRRPVCKAGCTPGDTFRFQ